MQSEDDPRSKPPERAFREGSFFDSWGARFIRYVWLQRDIRVSVCAALLVLALDVGLADSYLLSFVVVPFWILATVLKNAIQRPGLLLFVVRIAIPIVTLTAVYVNNECEISYAWENSFRLVAAIDRFHTTNHHYPKKLDELVPQYLPSVPSAKHFGMYNQFFYLNSDDKPMLIWWEVPPYGRRIYDFERKRWSYLE